jgi:hypothetical protein
MISTAATPEEFIAALPEDRKAAMKQLRGVIVKNIPKGFKETMAYGSLTWVVPHSLYPAGYHCDPKQPLPFVAIASQKNHIALYHMGIYAMPELLNWFTEAYPRHSTSKLDMGKSCTRFKKPEQLPFDLIGELMRKVTPEKWIEVYESNVKR